MPERVVQIRAGQALLLQDPGYSHQRGDRMNRDRKPEGTKGTGTTGGELWKFDMHVHSVYSGDSLNEPGDIVESFEKSGVLPLVCDHNRTAGSEVVCHELREIDPDLPVILAEEIMTGQGEIVGLFLTDCVPGFLDIRETLDIIHDQGGLALVPHPFCFFRGSTLWEDYRAEAIAEIDIVEGFNARVVYARDNAAAREFALRNNKPISVGSDSHRPQDLGQYWLELEPFSTPQELMRSLRAETVRYPVPGKRMTGE
jgi:predicted metal-dependent phosphoesterase TrpH